MVNRQLRKILLDKLRLSRQVLSQRAKKIKVNHGPMSTDEAVYLIAHQSGLDLSRFLSIAEIDRIRALVPRELPIVSAQLRNKITKKSQITIFSSRTYPLVTKSLITKSQQIGIESFPKMFILENSIRNLIIKLLYELHGKSWWTKVVSKGIRESVQRTIDKEKKYSHRKKRGLHPIYYSNFTDLKDIILQNRKVFSKVIFDFKWFEVKMDNVYMARNSLAHNTDITPNDRDEIRLFYSEWSQLLETAGIK